MTDKLLDKLKQLKSDGKSCFEIAAICGVRERQIHRWINGDTKISPLARELIEMKLEVMRK